LAVGGVWLLNRVEGADMTKSRIQRLLATLISAALLAVLTTVSAASPASATPYCSSPSADSDGDGWGYENGAPCLVYCEQSDMDPDGDGWVLTRPRARVAGLIGSIASCP